MISTLELAVHILALLWWLLAAALRPVADERYADPDRADFRS